MPAPMLGTLPDDPNLTPRVWDSAPLHTGKPMLGTFPVILNPALGRWCGTMQCVAAFSAAQYLPPFCPFNWRVKGQSNGSSSSFKAARSLVSLCSWSLRNPHLPRGGRASCRLLVRLFSVPIESNVSTLHREENKRIHNDHHMPAQHTPFPQR
eukprot:234644-Chlamydomonas_euryale.AAC.8